MKYTQEEIYEIVRLGDLATIVSMIRGCEVQML